MKKLSVVLIALLVIVFAMTSALAEGSAYYSEGKIHYSYSGVEIPRDVVFENTRNTVVGSGNGTFTVDLLPGTYTINIAGEDVKFTVGQDDHEHKWGDWVVTPATCTADGSKVRTCSFCGATESEVLPMIEHTIVESGAVEATCTTPGATALKQCSACGKVFQKSEVIPALGHVEVEIPGVAATCTKTGAASGILCTRCGTVLLNPVTIAPLGHDWDEGVVTKEATETEDGVKTYTCKRCSETKTEVIPATEAEEVANVYELDVSGVSIDANKTKSVGTGAVKLVKGNQAIDTMYVRITWVYDLPEEELTMSYTGSKTVKVGTDGKMTFNTVSPIAPYGAELVEVQFALVSVEDSETIAAYAPYLLAETVKIGE